MKNSIRISAIFLFLIAGLLGIAQDKEYTTSEFDKVIVSPHIEVEFVEGQTEKVEVLSNTEPLSKLNVDVKNEVLHVYLDDARVSTKQTKTKGDNWTYKEGIYKGKVATLRITYVDLEECDIRGEEGAHFKSTIDRSAFKLAVYGESDVIVEDIQVNDLKVAIYGESHLTMKAGAVNHQKYVTYGESVVEASAVSSNETKITAYGEGEYFFKVENDLKVTSFGESLIYYVGNPELSKRIMLGETIVKRKG